MRTSLGAGAVATPPRERLLMTHTRVVLVPDNRPVTHELIPLARVTGTVSSLMPAGGMALILALCVGQWMPPPQMRQHTQWR